jgi:hypothetical protein
MLIAALCSSESARLYRDDGPPIRHDFRLPPLPDDAPIDPDSPPAELPQLESTLPKVEIQSSTTGERIRVRQSLDDMGSNSLNPADMSPEEREALLSAEVQNDSQAVVDCVIRFGYWRDNSGRLHAHATWGLCAVLELPARQAYSRLPVVEASQAPPSLPCLPVDYGELSIFGSTNIEAVNRYLSDDYRIAPRQFDRPAFDHLDRMIQAIAAFVRDVAAVQAIDRELRETIGAA